MGGGVTYSDIQPVRPPRRPSCCRGNSRRRTECSVGALSAQAEVGVKSLMMQEREQRKDETKRSTNDSFIILLMRCRGCVYVCGGLDNPISKQRVTPPLPHPTPNNEIGLRLAVSFKITIVFATSPPTMAQNQEENDAISPSENKQWLRW